MYISGSSQYAAQAALSAQQGQIPQAPANSGAVRLLSTGQDSGSAAADIFSNLGPTGQSSALFGLTAASDLSTQALTTEIKAIRASTPDDQLSEQILSASGRGDNVDVEA